MLAKFPHGALLAMFIWIGSFNVLADTATLRSKFASLKIDAVFPGDPEYQKSAGSFNRRLTYMPAAIVFPNDKDAVAATILVAVKENLHVSPRSGGHSYAAYGLGGANGVLVIDLQRLKTISVDKSTWKAVIATGNRLGDIAIELNKQGGRALPHGTCSYVGIGGHVAFGGQGFTSRLWGLTLDNIIQHEIVLANGTITTASKNFNSDLFWALRGAGASYGVITALHFQTQSAPSQTTSFVYRWEMPASDFSEALIKFQNFCISGPPAQLGVDANLKKGGRSGKLMMIVTGAWYGQSSAFPAVIQPFLSTMHAPDSQSVKTTDWITSLEGTAYPNALSSSGVDLTKEHDTFYAKSLTTPQSTPMSNSSIRAFSYFLSTEGFQTDTAWYVQFELYGGKNSAITSVGKDDTAFAQRSILFTLQFYASSSNFAPPYPAAGYTFLDRMVATIVNNNPPQWQYGAYANYVDDRLSPSQWKSQYYNSHYQRLTQIKSIYDPRNVFAYPQGITEAITTRSQKA